MTFTPAKCAGDECVRDAVAKGLCGKHYQRLKNHGATTDPRPTLEERFWAKVDRRGPSECWPWTGAKNMNGYGVISVKRKLTSAHRVIYTWTHGEPPSGTVLDHTCHNPDKSCPGGMTCPHRACVNPAHLEPVTNTENLRRSRLGRPSWWNKSPAVGGSLDA